ncbi:MAG: hypothetical protein KKH41_05690 [Candidatus Thermoplasmatota archaeon]|nr:hypothetical protein [Euryarchaeota archaeon]MBU4031264.1 hypothetical protein [Candidatus Thermoplasmatota archaeon]MBU4070726.1 hypothetical protein [Candidatus Thermoplasmatota archaeon]MBU4144967.1 hypothetical protein [Candidatus Thermoplasmatota archaeon]MBU4592059.1 hypothetical protein [Candidatus Thermoplasmatota archaeon]
MIRQHTNKIKIEIYIAYTKGYIIGKNVKMGFFHGADIYASYSNRCFSELSEKEREFINKFKHLENEDSIEIKIYDTTRTLHAFRAFINGIWKMPAAKIGRYLLLENTQEAEINYAIEMTARGYKSPK